MIDPALHSELRERFNPDGSPLRRHQLLMLDMLKKIDRLCRDNGITYWLSSGTCIGALRHGGFIPWDDDVDIEMFEPDFKRLRRLMMDYSGDDLVWQDSSTDYEYVQPFAKIRDTHTEICELENADRNYKYRGAFIDVFVLRPSSSLKLYEFGGKFQQLFFYRTQRLENRFLRRSVLSFSRVFVSRMVFPLLNYIGLVGSNGQFRHRLGTNFTKARSMEDIKSTRLVEFEDTMLPVPVNAENYLRKIYGNYESVPDLDNITPHITEIKYF